MTARISHQQPDQPTTATRARTIPSSSTVMNVVVRVAGIVPVRFDVAHVGTTEQQLGLSLGTVLVYLRSGRTARSVAEEWNNARVLVRSLAPAVVGRRPLPIGPSVVTAMVQLAGVPRVVSAAEPARPGVPAMLRVQVGPVTWQVCDATAYASLLRAWRQAARLLGDNPREDD